MLIIKENIDKVLSKWRSYNVSLNVLNHQLESLYFLIYFGGKEHKKKFKDLHYLKMKRDYIYLKIYHNEIKTISDHYQQLAVGCYINLINKNT